MAKQDKYISMKKFVNGFSFANLGLFTGFGNGIYNAVYSLVLIEILKSSAVVGIYVSIYSVFCMFVALFANELLRHFSKAKLFYTVMLSMAICYFMMGFSIRPGTFIVLDYVTGIAIVLVSTLIPLFMADFSKKIGMAKLNARYHLWLNIGALFAPTIAMFVAGHFGNRSAFFASAVVYMLGFWFFKYFKIVQEDKKARKPNPRRTLKSLWKNTTSFFMRRDLMRAYIVNFGYYALQNMRVLYVPIMMIERGFSKDTLGLVLTIGIIPYLLMSELMGRLAQKYGTKIWLTIGFMSFAAFSVWATVATGWWLPAIFVMWQFSGAFMESVHDLLFFDSAKKTEQSKYYGVFRTSQNLPSVVAPMIAAGFITFFGGTWAVWLVTAGIAVLCTMVLHTKTK